MTIQRILIGLAFGSIMTLSSPAMAERTNLVVKDSYNEEFRAKDNLSFVKLLDDAWAEEIKVLPTGASHGYVFAEVVVEGRRFVISQLDYFDCKPGKCDWKVIETNADNQLLRIGDIVTACGLNGPVSYEDGVVTICDKKKVTLP